MLTLKMPTKHLQIKLGTVGRWMDFWGAFLCYLFFFCITGDWLMCDCVAASLKKYYHKCVRAHSNRLDEYRYICKNVQTHDVPHSVLFQPSRIRGIDEAWLLSPADENGSLIIILVHPTGQTDCMLCSNFPQLKYESHQLLLLLNLGFWMLMMLKWGWFTFKSAPNKMLRVRATRW